MNEVLKIILIALACILGTSALFVSFIFFIASKSETRSISSD